MALLLSSLVPAASLGDAVDESRRQEAEDAAKTVVGQATVARMECKVYEASLTAKLRLPDAYSGKSFTAPNNRSIILFVHGELINRGNAEQTASYPDFISASGKQFSPEKLYMKHSDANMYIELNPSCSYEFAAYYILPVEEVAGGKLRHKEGAFGHGDYVDIDLSLSQSSTIEDILIRRGITNNLFDTDD